MNGIIFLGTRKFAEIRTFYTETLGCDVWLEQADCLIVKEGNLLIGFCAREQADTAGMITFFYDTPAEVDGAYETLRSIATSEPESVDKYAIYRFFGADPEGRILEFQAFNRSPERFLDGAQLLLQRRSVREFLPTEVTPELLKRIWEMCRYAPTARNSQSYYFKPIYDRTLLEWLAGVREQSSAPIARAPMAVAICADPELSTRHLQDGCIAAYHLLLAAHYHGLGTCWIADLDREEIKERLGIPAAHYLVTVTPLGYRQGAVPPLRERHAADWFVRP